jgi:TonB family protein
MKQLCVVALLMALPAGLACKPPSGQATAAPQTDSSGPVKVYRVGKDVTAPELLPSDFSSAIANGCGESSSETIELSMIVDASGTPRNIAFIRPLGNALDDVALTIADSDRFKPGERNGVPVAVAQSIELRLDGCIIRVVDQPGHSVQQMRLSSQPKQVLRPYKDAPTQAILAPVSSSKDLSNPYHATGSVRAPVPLINPQAEYSEQARAARFEGKCLVSVIVDSEGMPRNAHVMRSLGMGLDEKAVEAVNRSRFKPGMLNGTQPVNVLIAVMIDFRL